MVLCPWRALPPVEFCLGTRPFQAAISRPVLKTCGSGIEAIKTENPGGLPEIDLLDNRDMMKLRGRDGELVVWTIDNVPAD